MKLHNLVLEVLENQSSELIQILYEQIVGSKLKFTIIASGRPWLI